MVMEGRAWGLIHKGVVIWMIVPKLLTKWLIGRWAGMKEASVGDLVCSALTSVVVEEIVE